MEASAIAPAVLLWLGGVWNSKQAASLFSLLLTVNEFLNGDEGCKPSTLSSPKQRLGKVFHHNNTNGPRTAHISQLSPITKPCQAGLVSSNTGSGECLPFPSINRQ